MESTLPLISTSLIGVSGISLLTGFFFIRRRDIKKHRIAMLTATTFAALFLVAYVTRWTLYGDKVFEGEGTARSVYLIILATHIVLATAIIPFVLTVLYRAFKRQFPKHRRIARVTFPMWLYVVVTGWIIYLMLYQIDFTST